MMDGNKVGIPNETTALLRTLEREIERLRGELAKWQAVADSRDEINSGLQRELAEARADAERYRWLREHDTLARRVHGADLDDAIDAARGLGD